MRVYVTTSEHWRLGTRRVADFTSLLTVTWWLQDGAASLEFTSLLGMRRWAEFRREFRHVPGGTEAVEAEAPEDETRARRGRGTGGRPRLEA